MAIPIKNRFEALQAQDPCAPQSQETIIETLKKKNDLLRKKATRQPTPLVTSPITTNKNNAARTSTSPAAPPKKTTTPHHSTLLKNQNYKGLPPSHPAEEQADPPTSAKGARPPPINITLQDPKDTIALMETSLKIKNFHIKRIHSGKHVLYLQNINDYTNAKKILTAANTANFTYTPKSQKPHTYLLKGLGNSYTEAEILEDLKALNIEEVNFTKVTRFTTRKSRENNTLLPIYIIQVSPDSNIGNLLKINRLNYLKIAWEKIKKNNDITQCYKCQRIGHTAQNCNLNYRCVKCTEPHGPGECKIKKEAAVSKEKIYCVNCKNYGHPASYKGCPKLVELRKKINEKITKAKTSKTERIAKISRKYVPELKFADIVKQKTSINETSPLVTNLAAQALTKPKPNNRRTPNKHNKCH